MEAVSRYGRPMGCFWGHITVFAILWGLAATVCGEDLSGRYVWPIAGQTGISSGFCDYRGMHFHGGIDVSTGGREGFQVRAADSGWVMRVSMSYWGYGKAVYIRMLDGRTAVYGHLSELSPRIQTYVESNQYAARRYKQNLWPAPHEIPVGRGEVIGKTGQTGSGPPHLHFEIRTADNRPLNPLKVAFDKPDNTPPSLKAITLIPRQPHETGVPLSLVDGQLAPKTYKFSGSARSRSLGDTPAISGIVGIALHSDDIISSSKWKASTYRLRLWVNDVLISEVRHDSILYDDTRLISLERVFDGKPGYAERPVNLHRYPGNRLWHYVSLTNDGWLETGKTVMSGLNEVRIEIEDAAGNTAAGVFEILVGDQPAIHRETPAGSETVAMEMPRVTGTRWMRGGIALHLEGTRDGEGCFYDPGMTRPIPAIPAPEGGHTAWVSAELVQRDTIWLRAPGSAVPYPLGMQAVTDMDGGFVISRDGRATVDFGPGDLYAASFFSMTRTDVPPGLPRTVSGAYRLDPADVPFARPALVSIGFEVASDADRLGLYQLNTRKKKWVFVGADRDNDLRTVSGKIRQPGTFALLADLDPPVIRHVKPGRGAVTSRKRPTIRFEMFDELSGIGSDADVTLTIDGEWVPVEYDPDIRRARARPRKPLAPGKHRVEITAIDRAGNRESFLRILTIKK